MVKFKQYWLDGRQQQWLAPFAVQNNASEASRNHSLTTPWRVCFEDRRLFWLLAELVYLPFSFGSFDLILAT
jgi:hypothetical protein